MLLFLVLYPIYEYVGEGSKKLKLLTNPPRYNIQIYASEGATLKITLLGT